VTHLEKYLKGAINLITQGCSQTQWSSSACTGPVSYMGKGSIGSCTSVKESMRIAVPFPMAAIQTDEWWWRCVTRSGLKAKCIDI